MDANSISTILKIGENIAVEFKRCGNGIENDVYAVSYTHLTLPTKRIV